MVRKVLVAVRQTAPWQALAGEYAAAGHVAPEKYLPAGSVPNFPGFMADCLDGWNRLFAVDFFTCRAELQRIARATLDRIENATVAPAGEILGLIPQDDFRLFFVDDDDWFAPDTARRLACTGDEDVAVFPLPRLDAPVFTFAHDGTPQDAIVGKAQAFTFRYQTNNYALHPRLTTPVMLGMLADHATASATAARIGLRDAYHPVIVSATNKTPVSASVLMRIAEEGRSFRRHVDGFIESLRNLDPPPGADWLREPAAATLALFERV
jgi:hypothetical protein